MQSSKRKISDLENDQTVTFLTESFSTEPIYIPTTTQTGAVNNQVVSSNGDTSTDKPELFFNPEMDLLEMQNLIYKISLSNTQQCHALRVLAQVLPPNLDNKTVIYLSDKINLDKLRHLLVVTLFDLRHAAGIGVICWNREKQSSIMVLDDVGRYQHFRKTLTSVFQPCTELPRMKTEKLRLQSVSIPTPTPTPIPEPMPAPQKRYKQQINFERMTIEEIQQYIINLSKTDTVEHQYLKFIADSLPPCSKNYMNVHLHKTIDMEQIRAAFNQFNGLKHAVGIKTFTTIDGDNTVLLRDRDRYAKFIDTLTNYICDDQVKEIRNIPFQSMDLIQTIITIDEIARKNNKFYEILKNINDLFKDYTLVKQASSSRAIVNEHNFKDIKNIIYTVPDLYLAIGITYYKFPDTIYLSKEMRFNGFIQVLKSLFSSPVVEQQNHNVQPTPFETEQVHTFYTESFTPAPFNADEPVQSFSTEPLPSFTTQQLSSLPTQQSPSLPNEPLPSLSMLPLLSFANTSETSFSQEHGLFAHDELEECLKKAFTSSSKPSIK